MIQKLLLSQIYTGWAFCTIRRKLLVVNILWLGLDSLHCSIYKIWRVKQRKCGWRKKVGGYSLPSLAFLLIGRGTWIMTGGKALASFSYTCFTSPHTPYSERLFLHLLLGRKTPHTPKDFSYIFWLFGRAISEMLQFLKFQVNCSA